MASLNTPKLYSLATMQAFLDGSLDAETQSAVEKLLAENPDYALAMEGLDRNQSESLSQRDSDQKAFKEYITTLTKSEEDKKDSFEEPLVRDLRSARWWQIAAVILILALPLAYFFQKPTLTTDQLAMANLEPFTFSGLRGGEDVTTMLDSILDIYEVGRSRFASNPEAYLNDTPAEFEAAKLGFIQVLSQPIDSLGTQQYLKAKMGLGLCLLFQGYQNEAIEQFEVVIQQGDNIWIAPAKWYKAWSLIYLDRKAEAKTVLNKLRNKKSDYREAAQNLLDEL